MFLGGRGDISLADGKYSLCSQRRGRETRCVERKFAFFGGEKSSAITNKRGIN